MPVNAQKPHIYVDLDRTLFDTDRAGLALKVAAQELYGLDAQQLAREESRFYVHVGNQYFYRFFDHLAARDVEPAKAAGELLEVLKGQDFLYPDAHEFVAHLRLNGYNSSILSFGDPAYQGFKYRLAPALANLPFICVDTPKGEYVRKHGQADSVIIDDKHVGAVPDACRAIQLMRGHHQPVSRADGRYIINDLRLAKGLIT